MGGERNDVIYRRTKIKVSIDFLLEIMEALFLVRNYAGFGLLRMCLGLWKSNSSPCLCLTWPSLVCVVSSLPSLTRSLVIEFQDGFTCRPLITSADSFSKQGPIHRIWGLEGGPTFWGTTIKPTIEAFPAESTVMRLRQCGISCKVQEMPKKLININK